jgi:hypothetical protein
VTAAEVTHLHTARLRRAAVHGDADAALILTYRAERDAAIRVWRETGVDPDPDVAGFDEMNRRESQLPMRARRLAQYWLTRLADALEPN